uniref:LRRCT domain-containing protein n=1 Tax=Branchiostoma floridae TaxID=7739 RepID=C3ZPT6_BRAFL|eukprot:XP_002589304.1 hypothetical protein BRAFLDRAFT_97374 [Branchiostoma floridae]
MGVPPRTSSMKVFRRIEGNPIRCDCCMSWLAKLAAQIDELCTRYNPLRPCPRELSTGPFYKSLKLVLESKCSDPDHFKDSPLYDVNLHDCNVTTSDDCFRTTVATSTTAKSRAIFVAQTTKDSLTSKGATEQSTTIFKAGQAEALVTITSPNITVSSVNEHHTHIIRLTNATNEVKASTSVPKASGSALKVSDSVPKTSTSTPKASDSALNASSSVPKAAIIAIAVVAALFLTLAIAACTRKFIQKRPNHDEEDDKGKGIELSKTAAGPVANQ